MLSRLSELVKMLRFYANRSPIFFNSAALSYFSILALIPMIVVIFSILALLNVIGLEDDHNLQIKGFILKLLGSGAGNNSNLIQYFENTMNNFDVGRIGIIGIAALLITITSLLSNIEKGFNEIWGVEKSRAQITRFLSFWTVTTLGSFLIAISIGIGIKINQVVPVDTLITIERSIVDKFTLWTLPILMSFSLFTLMYKFMPNAKVKTMHAVIGGLFAAICFEFLKNTYTRYVATSITNSDVYGSLSVVPVFFLWIYINWVVVLIGGLITFVTGNYYELHLAFREGRLPSGWHHYLPLALLYQICLYFSTRSRQDNAPTTDQLLRDIKLPYDTLERMLKLLDQKQWVKRIYNKDESRGYIPALSPEKIVIREFLTDVMFANDDAHRALPSDLRKESKHEIASTEILKHYFREPALVDYICRVQAEQFGEFLNINIADVIRDTAGVSEFTANADPAALPSNDELFADTGF